MQVDVVATPSVVPQELHGLQSDKIACEMEITLLRSETETAAADVRLL